MSANPLWCFHPRRTPDDGHGYSLCTDCGSTIVVYLTREMLDKTFASVPPDRKGSK